MIKKFFLINIIVFSLLGCFTEAMTDFKESGEEIKKDAEGVVESVVNIAD